MQPLWSGTRFTCIARASSVGMFSFFKEITCALKERKTYSFRFRSEENEEAVYQPDNQILSSASTIVLSWWLLRKRFNFFLNVWKMNNMHWKIIIIYLCPMCLEKVTFVVREIVRVKSSNEITFMMKTIRVPRRLNVAIWSFKLSWVISCRRLFIVPPSVFSPPILFRRISNIKNSSFGIRS